jgi:glucosamine-6-phosphate deaminase
MEKHLFSKTDFRRTAIHSFNGMAGDIEMECRKYEEAIKKAGGISLVFLGIGANGHIAYNEPGSNRLSRTRLVALSKETRRAIQKNFPGDNPRNMPLRWE